MNETYTYKREKFKAKWFYKQFCFLTTQFFSDYNFP